jgi:hypothetical protein
VSHQTPRSLVAALISSIALGLVCGVGAQSESETGEAVEPASEAEEATGPAEDRTPHSAVEAELIEQLSAIGYTAGTEDAGASSGVVHHEADRVSPGMNFLTSGHAPCAQLMDMDGEIVHEWRAEFGEIFPNHPKRDPGMEPYRNFWRNAVLLPNGDIIAIWELFGIFKLDRDSRVLWAVEEPAHHDLQITTAGEIVHLQSERRMIPGIDEKRAIEDYIVVRDAAGRELRKLAMSDALRNADWLALRKAFWRRVEERGYGLSERGLYDPFHTNSLWLLTEVDAERLGDPFRAGDALVSMRMLDTIAVIDMERGLARWWQQGPFGMQHQPRPTPDGAIILFNNFLTAEQSSVLTLDPRTREVIQEYTGPEADPLHSHQSGRVEVLPNGNVLIVETDGGRALEVTQDGEVVWDFRSPHRTDRRGEIVANLYSLDRVGEAQTGWLAGSLTHRLESALVTRTCQTPAPQR